MEDSSLRKAVSSNVIRQRANSVALMLGGHSGSPHHNPQFDNPDILGKSWNRGFSRMYLS